MLSLLGLLIAYYAFPVEAGNSIAADRAQRRPHGGRGWSCGLRDDGRTQPGTSGAKADPTADPGVDGGLHGDVASRWRSSSWTWWIADQIDGLETRTDALYFTLSTMATVGFGDVHAVGQLARVTVSFMIVFNIVVVAALAREATRRVDPDEAAPSDDAG